MIILSDIAVALDSPKRLHLKKVLHTQLSTTRQLQLTANVRTEEIAPVLRVMHQDGATVVPVRTYIEVAVTIILSHMILKKCFMAVASTRDEAVHSEVELEQVRNFRELTDDISKFALSINPGDFIPLLKWFDFLGFENQFQKLRVRMDAFMSTIISEHVEQRKSGPPIVKDMADVLLDELEDETLRYDITNVHINSTLWVRAHFLATSCV